LVDRGVGGLFGHAVTAWRGGCHAVVDPFVVVGVRRSSWS
jgi:hypothetical protein